MAISPIGVSFKNNYNVSFESRKEKGSERHSNPISHKLAIPAAALILSMYPSNNVDAQNVIREGLTENKTVEVYNGKYSKKFIYTEEVASTDYITIPTKLEFTSSDDDDIPEYVRLKKTEKIATGIDINGVRKKVISQSDVNMKIDSLMIEHVTDTRNGEIRKYNLYYAIGDMLTELTYFDRENPKELVGKPKRGKVINGKISISKNLYNIISDTMGDKINYTASTATRRY